MYIILEKVTAADITGIAALAQTQATSLKCMFMFSYCLKESRKVIKVIFLAYLVYSYVVPDPSNG